MGMLDERTRAARLTAAQDKAVELFAEVERRGMIAPGLGERAVSDSIRELANQLFGVKRYWHKRIVRSGPHTLDPYAANPPDRVITADDMVFVDFGPLFEEWEADFGRSYVLGDDPVKHRLCADLPAVFAAGRRYFEDHPEITGAQLFAEVKRLSAEAGWEFGGRHSGHMVGEFPHERISDDQIQDYVTDGSDHPMRRRDRYGRICHWILEVHLVHREGGFGGFYEQLLDLA
jgi:Xaa-Pro aminopeptidase